MLFFSTVLTPISDLHGNLDITSPVITALFKKKFYNYLNFKFFFFENTKKLFFQ